MSRRHRPAGGADRLRIPFGSGRRAHLGLAGRRRCRPADGRDSPRALGYVARRSRSAHRRHRRRVVQLTGGQCRGQPGEVQGHRRGASLHCATWAVSGRGRARAVPGGLLRLLRRRARTSGSSCRRSRRRATARRRGGRRRQGRRDEHPGELRQRRRAPVVALRGPRPPTSGRSSAPPPAHGRRALPTGPCSSTRTCRRRRTCKPTGSYPSVALVGLVGPDGQVEVVTAQFRLTLEATGLGSAPDRRSPGRPGPGQGRRRLAHRQLLRHRHPGHGGGRTSTTAAR